MYAKMKRRVKRYKQNVRGTPSVSRMTAAVVVGMTTTTTTTILTDVLGITVQDDLVTPLAQAQILESVQHDLAHTVALVIRVDDNILDVTHDSGVSEEFTLDDQAGGSDDLALVLDVFKDNDKVGRGASEEIIESRFVHFRGQRRGRGQCGK